MRVVQLVWLQTDDRGEPHMDPQEIAIRSSGLAPPAPPLGVSLMEPAAGRRFLQLPSGWVGQGEG